MGNKIHDSKLMEKVISALKQVYDPEIPVNVYDLGLIYDLAIEDDGTVKIEMTLTNPNCPIADNLIKDIEKEILLLGDFKKVDIKLVFEPAWTPDRMSDAARLDLDMF